MSDESSETKNILRIDASYGAFGMGADLNVKFSNAIDKASKKSTLLQCKRISDRRQRKYVVVFNPAEIADSGKEFFRYRTDGDGVAYEIIRVSYEKSAAPCSNYIELKNRKEILNAYAKDIIDLRKVAVNDLKYILLNPWELEYPGRADSEVNEGRHKQDQ